MKQLNDNFFEQFGGKAFEKKQMNSNYNNLSGLRTRPVNPWDKYPVYVATNTQQPRHTHDSTTMQYFMYGYGMALVTVFVAVCVFKKLMK